MRLLITLTTKTMGKEDNGDGDRPQFLQMCICLNSKFHILHSKVQIVVRAWVGGPDRTSDISKLKRSHIIECFNQLVELKNGKFPENQDCFNEIIWQWRIIGAGMNIIVWVLKTNSLRIRNIWSRNQQNNPGNLKQN